MSVKTDTFPTAPLRTGLATFKASGSPVNLSLDVQKYIGSLHYASLCICHLVHLSPFAMWSAFPSSDYYGDSVPMRLSPFRESRVFPSIDV